MNRYDAMVGMGVGMIGVGLWFIYPPAAVIVVGVFLIGIGVIGAWMQAVGPIEVPIPKRKGSGE